MVTFLSIAGAVLAVWIAGAIVTRIKLTGYFVDNAVYCYYRNPNWFKGSSFEPRWHLNLVNLGKEYIPKNDEEVQYIYLAGRDKAKSFSFWWFFTIPAFFIADAERKARQRGLDKYSGQVLEQHRTMALGEAYRADDEKACVELIEAQTLTQIKEIKERMANRVRSIAMQKNYENRKPRRVSNYR